MKTMFDGSLYGRNQNCIRSEAGWPSYTTFVQFSARNHNIYVGLRSLKYIFSFKNKSPSRIVGLFRDLFNAMSFRSMFLNSDIIVVNTLRFFHDYLAWASFLRVLFHLHLLQVWFSSMIIWTLRVNKFVFAGFKKI